MRERTYQIDQDEDEDEDKSGIYFDQVVEKKRGKERRKMQRLLDSMVLFGVEGEMMDMMGICWKTLVALCFFGGQRD